MDQNKLALLKQQINAKLENEEFCTAFLQAGNVENLVQLLNKNGIEATADEVTEIVNEGNAALAAVKDAPDGELTEDELESVAGGKGWRRFFRGVASVVSGAALGFGLGALCGVFPGFAPVAYKIGVGYGLAAGVWIAKG